MKYYVIYKTTNLINNKYYIGKQKTNNPYDDYLGSGTLIEKAIEKYGENNFKKEILFCAFTEKIAFEVEKEFVNEETINDSLCYNLKEGGDGGWDCVNKTGQNIYGKNKENLEKFATPKAHEKIKELRKDEEWYRNHSKNISLSLKKYYSDGGRKPMAGKSHTEETKRKISKELSIKQNGERNSQYGTCWIYDPNTLENFKIKKENLDYYIEQGYYKGRYINKRYVECADCKSKFIKNGNEKYCSKECKKRNINRNYTYEYVKELFDEFCNEETSYRKFVKDKNLNFSHVSLYKMFKRFGLYKELQNN